MKKLEEYLKQQCGVTDDKIKSIYSEIKKILAHTIRCAELKLDKKVGYFEVLGCDIMLDDQLKPYLIEINSNPALFTDTTTQKEVIPAVVTKVKFLIDFS
jgi:Tubulin-tyrosine ligase family.